MLRPQYKEELVTQFKEIFLVYSENRVKNINATSRGQNAVFNVKIRQYIH
jgi:hypothetical protein